MGAGVLRDVLRIRSDRYLVPTNRHGVSGAGTSSAPAAASPRYGRHGSGTGAQLRQSGHQRNRRRVALGLALVARCPQTLARDGVRGGIADATDRFSRLVQLLITIRRATTPEGLLVLQGG